MMTRLLQRSLGALVLLAAPGCDDEPGTSDSDTEGGQTTEGGSSTGSQPDYEPLYEPDECRYGFDPDADVECGFLTVPEDRHDPEGAVVRLHVSIFHSRAETALPDPVFLLNGGPGAPSIPAIGLLLSPTGERLRAERDVIYVDQRGTNFSEPALYCTEPLVVDPRADFDSYVAERAQWAQRCHDDLLAAGTCLSCYNTEDNAADIEDLRLALGYPQINLVGASYGTRLAMTFMRRFPESVRSAVLDSVLPPNINPYHEGTASVRSSLDAFFDEQPQLEAPFEQVAQTLRAQPVEVPLATDDGEQPVRVDDVIFVNDIRGRLTSSPRDTEVGAIILAAASGDLEPTARSWLETVTEHTTSGPGSFVSAEGMFASVFCAEDGSRTSREQAIAADASHPEDNASVRAWAIAYQIGQLFSPCEFWDVDPVDPSFFDPLHSDRPTLVLAGTLDAQTPPHFADAAVEGLSNWARFEMPTGHVTLATACGAELTGDFLDDPGTDPTTDCAVQVD